MKNEKKLPDTDPQNTSIMPGPYPPPPPPEEHMVAFKFWVGEQVRVRNIDVICLVDNGSREKWYAEDLLDYPYVYFGGDEKPSVPPPVVHD
jgi:hypothetical protein